MDGAREAVDTRPDLALPLVLRAGEASWWAGDPAWSDAVSEVAARIHVDCPEHASTQALLVGSALLLRGELDAGAAELRRVVVPEPSSTDARAWISAAAAALYLGDEDAARARYGRAVDILRGAGCDRRAALRAVPDRGDGSRRRPLRDAAANAEESLRLAVETRQETDRCYVLSLLASIAAVRGATEECEAKAGEALEAATAQGLGAASQHARWALGRLELGHARPAEALAHLLMLGEGGDAPPTPLVSLLASPDVVEAAVACRAAAGRPRGARALRELGHRRRLGVMGGDRRAAARAAGRGRRGGRPLLRGGDRARVRPAPAVRAGAHPPRLRRASAPVTPPSRRPHAPACGAGRLRGARRGRLGGARPGRAAGQRRDVAPRRRGRAGAAHPAGAADRALRHRGRLEPRGRVPALREPADGRAPPEQDLLQARHQLTRRARAGARRARDAPANGRCPR